MSDGYDALWPLFRALPWREQLHVRARASSAPLLALAARTPTGRVADVGCGHGLLAALLAKDGARDVVGVDPDERKIRWARSSVGALPNVSFHTGTVESLLPDEAGRFDAVVVADVLYLLPELDASRALASAFALLKPGGRLLVHEAEADGSWRALKWRAQEWVMVELLGRTRGSGALGLLPRQQHVERISRAGFQVDPPESFARGYTSPHVLFSARR